jgi:glycerol-3-phosphate dehydrogenase
VTGFIREGDTIRGVHTRNVRTGQEEDFYAPVTVNACGIWGQRIASLAGVSIGMFPSKGALLIFAHRINNMVINRCRKPANADILVPGETVCVIGTTSTRIPFEECDRVAATPEEVDLLISEGAKLSPALSSTRILRAYAGVRPLVSADDDPSGRNISRGIVCLDHETRDGLKGFITITGGKLMTYRLMAEMATDAICRKFGVDKRCATAATPLPALIEPSDGKGALICECENVTAGKVAQALERLEVSTLTDLRRRTRVGMGTCQGGLCACRAADLLAQANGCVERERADLSDFMQERWKGNYPIGWGDMLREAEYTQWVYKHVLGL